MSNDPRDPCISCGLCCRSYLVPLFGQDLYRLVKQRGMDPREFVFICEQEQPDRVGFRLCRDGATYGLALDKKEKLEVNQPCTFLVERGDGSSRCGVYEDRPIACVTYPMVRAPEGIALLPAALCAPDAWEAEEASNSRWRVNLRRLSRYRDTYVEVVSRWNAWITSTPDVSRPAEHFVAYVLQVYDRLAQLDDELGNDALSAIERAWATLPHDAPMDGRKDAEPNWITYLRRARQVIDEFFPEMPPLPLARIAIEVERSSAPESVG